MLQEECRTLRNKNMVDGEGGQSSLWHCAFQKVRDQPAGPQQLTAAVFPILVRMVVVVVETVNGEDSREPVRIGNGMKMSRGTLLSFGIPLLLSSL